MWPRNYCPSLIEVRRSPDIDVKHSDASRLHRAIVAAPGNRCCRHGADTANMKQAGMPVMQRFSAADPIAESTGLGFVQPEPTRSAATIAVRRRGKFDMTFPFGDRHQRTTDDLGAGR
jgi:hypothetical protein